MFWSAGVVIVLNFIFLSCDFKGRQMILRFNIAVLFAFSCYPRFLLILNFSVEGKHIFLILAMCIILCLVSGTDLCQFYLCISILMKEPCLLVFLQYNQPHTFVVVSLDPPIRKGQTLYLFCIIDIAKSPVVILLCRYSISSLLHY